MLSDDDLKRLTSITDDDQRRATLANFARLIADYQQALIAVGFGQQEALALTLAFQHTVLELQKGG